MPMKVVGDERWLSWVPKGTSGRNLLGAPRAPTVGLGPVGMVGSVGYTPNNLSPQAQKWERMGLYWTGHGVAQGRPLAEIEHGMGLADRGANLQERKFGQDVVEADRSHGLSQMNSDRTYDLGLRGVEQSGERISLDKAKLDADKKHRDAELGISQGQLDLQRVQGLSALDPKSQPEASRLLGLAKPVEPLVPVGKKGEPVSPFPEATDKNDVDAARQAMALNPADPRYEHNIKRVADAYKVKGGHGGLKLLMQRYGPAIQAEDAHKAGGMQSAESSADGVDADRVEAIFQHYGGKISRDQIIAKLRNRSQ
jgi:hypothetical protein